MHRVKVSESVVQGRAEHGSFPTSSINNTSGTHLQVQEEEKAAEEGHLQTESDTAAIISGAVVWRDVWGV